ncbi:MAG: hypothetical protein RIS35_1013 [Pseudomonadota bacterium]|jgi:membrane protein implicated in regulation of membrane protease activity
MSFPSWQLLVAAALGLLILEALIPGFVFAGFAVGAVAVAGVHLVTDASPIALDLIVFSLASAAGFFALRRVFRNRDDARPGDGDVNRY